MIVAAINHWIDIRDNDEISTSFNCTLCDKYLWNAIESCTECPIYDKTKISSCRNTPYEKLVDHIHEVHDTGTIKNHCETCEQIIDEEINFLRSLHPFKIGDNVKVTRNWTDEEDDAYYTGKIQIDHQFEGTITDISQWGNCRIDHHSYPPCVLEPISINNTEKEQIDTSAKIHWKKELDKGEKKYRITKLEGFIGYGGLPKRYIDKPPYMFLDNHIGIDSVKVRLPPNTTSTNLHIFDEPHSPNFRITQNDIISETRMKETMQWIRICSGRLRKINRQLQTENADWNGEGVFEI